MFHYVLVVELSDYVGLQVIRRVATPQCSETYSPLTPKGLFEDSQDAPQKLPYEFFNSDVDDLDLFTVPETQIDESLPQTVLSTDEEKHCRSGQLLSDGYGPLETLIELYIVVQFSIVHFQLSQL